MTDTEYLLYEVGKWCDNNLCPSEGVPKIFGDEDTQKLFERTMEREFCW